jgi:small subunit ribosomal protein S17
MKTLEGIVKSIKMQKTAVVEVMRTWQHPIYKKRVKRTKRYLAHNEMELQPGARVTMVETRPISKLKRFKITNVLSK